MRKYFWRMISWLPLVDLPCFLSRLHHLLIRAGQRAEKPDGEDTTGGWGEGEALVVDVHVLVSTYQQSTPWEAGLRLAY